MARRNGLITITAVRCPGCGPKRRVRDPWLISLMGRKNAVLPISVPSMVLLPIHGCATCGAEVELTIEQEAN